MRVSFAGRAIVGGLSVLSALLMTSAAFAATDAKKVADDLVAAAQARGENKASYGSATADGNVVTITAFTLTSPHHSQLTIPSIVVTDPTDRQPGGFTAASIAFDAGTMVRRDDTATWKTAILKDAVVPAPSEIHLSTLKIVPFSHLAVSGISATNRKDQAEPATIDTLTFDLSNIVDGSPNAAKLLVSGITVPASVITRNPDAKALFDQLGYSSLVLDAAFSGTYDPSAQTLALDNVTLDGKGIGKLTVTGLFGGIERQTPDNNAKDTTAEAKQAAGKMTIKNLKVRFDDAGITTKVLAMQAKSMGTTPDSLAMMLPAALPLAFGQLNITDEAFQKKAVDAVSAYLKNPQSLTILLAPAKPIALAELTHSAMAAPTELLAMLGVDIQANN